LLRRTASSDPKVAQAAQYEFAQALQTPLRQGVLSGDIVDGIFEQEKLAPGATSDFPLDFVAPGTEKNYVAYTMPNAGYIPERHVEGDYVKVPTYNVSAAIDFLIRYARDARWNVVGRALQVLEAMFVKKLNDDAWHTLLSAGADRNILVFDSAASAGQFTKRVVSLGKTIMRRNGGGNSTSLSRSRLTDLYISPESMEDMRDWGVDQVDEVTRREIYVAEDGAVNRIFSVNLHDLDELGENQEYQNYFTSELGGSLASGDVELLVGLDRSRNHSFYMPVREEINIHEDPVLHRKGRVGYYGRGEYGVAVCDNRAVLLLSS
jgi:hypothetical protein